MGIDDVFAVIAEGTRRQILERLRDGDRAVGELVIELGVSQPTVSKHLKVLREAGLVTMRAQGQKRYYTLDTGPLDHVRAWLGRFDGTVEERSAVRPVGRHAASPAPSADVEHPVADAPPAALPDALVGALPDVLPDGTTTPEVLVAASIPDTIELLDQAAGEPAPDVLAAAVFTGSAPVSGADSGAGLLVTSDEGSPEVSGAGTVVLSGSVSPDVPGALAGPVTVRPIGRTRGRAAERAADLLAQLRRRRGTSS